MSAPQLIFVAQVGAAHGIQGEFKLISHMADPASVLEHNPLLDAEGNPALEITTAREHKGALIVRAKQAPDRTAAEKLNGLKLYIDRAVLPEVDEDEYYITDLIGMKVVDINNNPVGRVLNVENFGAGDLLDIQPESGPSFYLLFTNENVPAVRLDDRVVVVDLSNV